MSKFEKMLEKMEMNKVNENLTVEHSEWESKTGSTIAMHIQWEGASEWEMAEFDEFLKCGDGTASCTNTYEMIDGKEVQGCWATYPLLKCVSQTGCTGVFKPPCKWCSYLRE